MHGVRLLLVVWAALMALLVVTVGASFLLSGPASIGLSLGVALTKAALIYWFFMHLREEGGLVRLMAVGAGAWLLIFLLLCATDYGTRQPL